MAVLTPLLLADAQRVGRAYGLDVREVRPIPEGSVNSNFALLTAEGGRVFCRVYEEQSRDTADREAALLAHLAAREVPTPEPLARVDGAGFITEHGDKPVALFPWREGEMRCQRAVDAPSARAVGEALARVHSAGESFGASWPSRFGPTELRRRIEAVTRRALSPDLTATLARASSWLDEHEGALDVPGAPQATGLVHGDLFRDNVLWTGDRISALLDFESASHGSFAFDLMVCMLSWCYDDRLEPALMRAMVDGYASHRALPESMRADLYLQGCYAAVRFTVTRVTDFELRRLDDPHHRGVHKDYRRFAARLAELDALGEAGLWARLWPEG